MPLNTVNYSTVTDQSDCLNPHIYIYIYIYNNNNNLIYSIPHQKDNPSTKDKRLSPNIRYNALPYQLPL